MAKKKDKMKIKKKGRKKKKMDDLELKKKKGKKGKKKKNKKKGKKKKGKNKAKKNNESMVAAKEQEAAMVNKTSISEPVPTAMPDQTVAISSDRSVEFSARDAILKLRVIPSLKELNAFTRGERRKTVLHSVAIAKRRIAKSR